MKCEVRGLAINAKVVCSKTWGGETSWRKWEHGAKAFIPKLPRFGCQIQRKPKCRTREPPRTYRKSIYREAVTRNFYCLNRSRPYIHWNGRLRWCSCLLAGSLQTRNRGSYNCWRININEWLRLRCIVLLVVLASAELFIRSHEALFFLIKTLCGSRVPPLLGSRQWMTVRWFRCQDGVDIGRAIHGPGITLPLLSFLGQIPIAPNDFGQLIDLQILIFHAHFFWVWKVCGYAVRFNCQFMSCHVVSVRCARLLATVKSKINGRR